MTQPAHNQRPPELRGRWRRLGERIALRFAMLPLCGSICAFGSNLTSTLYVGRHFEVRDFDQPTKYVVNGETRVAEITGSLSTNSRVQRLRVYPGWNLCSIAVSGLFPAMGAESVLDVFGWNAGTRDYSRLATGQQVQAGAVLWIRARTNSVLSIEGNYTEPATKQVTDGGSYVSSAGLEVWQPALPNTTSDWQFEAGPAHWLERLADPLAQLLPASPVPPGAAFYVASATALLLEPPDTGLRIRYYHQDHLGSSTVISDANSDVIEETAYYPFGTRRTDWQPRRTSEPYKFTQKELDRETTLDEFGKRYYSSNLARWLSVDPKEEMGGGLNLYDYVNQQPLGKTDPDGSEIKVTKSEDKKSKETIYEIELSAVLLNTSDKNVSTKDLQAYTDKLTQAIEKSYSARDPKAKITFKTSAHIRVITDWSQRKANEHVFLLTGAYSMSGVGETRHGGMIMKVQVHSLFDKPPQPGDKYYATLRKSYKSPESIGAHEYGHAAGLDDIEDDISNLMSHGRENDSRQITLEQMNKVVSSKHNLPDE